MKRSVAILVSLIMALIGLGGCSQPSDDHTPTGLGNGWTSDHSLNLTYATQFSVDYYKDDLALITISDGSRFLVVPESVDVPKGIDKAITVLRQPITNIYLVATSAMCLFDAIGSLDSIRFSGLKASDWYIPNAKTAMDEGKILYAGKYSSPDYELILKTGSDLAVENTMIYHSPGIKEKLESVGVPVMIDRSSYEPHPLGRTEWIKLYGVLTGTEDVAERIFDEQVAYLDKVSGQPDTGKTVAYFYISSNGYVVTRKSGDYISKMIRLAGGEYVFKDLGDPETATSTVNLEMEQFYATAKDADYIIYNSTIGADLHSLNELIALNPLLADFTAVHDGHVWCTGKDFFQDTTQLGLMVSDMHEMLTSTDDTQTQLTFLHRLG